MTRGRLLLAGVLLAAAPALQASITIVAPSADAILYGPTRIVAAVEGHDEVGAVAFYVDRFPDPVCTVTAEPFVCDFDAGTRMLSRTIRADAVDGSGSVIARDTIATYSFVEPEEIVATTLTVPLVADGEGRRPELDDIDWDCRFDDVECAVVEARQLAVGDLSAAPVPVSLEVLVDVSPSVFADRGEIEDALRLVIDEAPVPVDISLSEFAGFYRRLTPFTDSKARLRRGLRRMERARAYSCVFGALRLALPQLHGRAGHKALLVISDGEETCEGRFAGGGSGQQPAAPSGGSGDPAEEVQGQSRAPSRSGSGSGPTFVNRRQAIRETLALSRQAGVPVYVYRVGGLGTNPRAVDTLQQIAGETGGRWLQRGDLNELKEALQMLLADLSRTWLLDIDLPHPGETAETGTLELGVIGQSVSLRYPDRLKRGNRETLLLGVLELGDDESRGVAAEQLRGSRSTRALRELMQAYRREPSAANRVEQMTAIYHIAAHLLLHGDREAQAASLETVAQLRKIDPVLIRRLRPALETFQKMDPPARLRRKAARLAAPTRWRTPAGRQG